jgi:hypothetical protein
MTSFSILHWIIFFVIIGIPLLLVFGALRAGVGRPGEKINTWKFRTIVFIILAVIIPAWPISIPLFLYLAFNSYKAGEIATGLSTQFSEGQQTVLQPIRQSKADEITALHQLLKSGALTQDEYDAEKSKVLGA